MSTHGLRQSEALTLAAQKLSRARQYRNSDADGEHRLHVAEAAYMAALKVYTNPFGVSKTFS